MGSKSLDLHRLPEWRRGKGGALRICGPEEKAKGMGGWKLAESAISESGSIDFGMARLGSTGYGLVI